MHLVPRLGSGIPLVARNAEMRRLRAAFSRAQERQAGAVLLAGDAGVGKTRLLAELGEYAAGKGALVLTGRCLDVREGGLPYLPFAEALTPLATAPEPEVAAVLAARPALARLLPQLTSVVPAGTAAGSEHQPVARADQEAMHRVRTEQDLGQLQLFDAMLGALTELAERSPVVLLVEDLHWADGSTRNLLSFLISRLRGQRLLVVASYREEDVHRRHPLRPVLAELVRMPTVERVDLPPFGAVEARTFVEALAEGTIGPSVLAGIVERSQGNPFFAEELLASCSDGSELPAGLVEVLLDRLERLAPDTRRALRVIAVANGPVPHHVLMEVAGLGELELEEALREAVQHHVLVIEDGSYAFRHALLQEAVYGDLLPGERSRMHGAYAARLAAEPEGRGRDASLAFHAMESNDLAIALAASVRAGREAEKLGAPGAALRHIEQALRIWDAVSPGDRPEGLDEARLLHEASYFAGTSGEPERAIAYARSAVQSLTDDLSADRAAKSWRRLAEALMALESTFEESYDAIGRAWEFAADASGVTRAWVLATRAQILRGLDRPEEALTSASAAVAEARDAGAGGAEASALVTLGTLADASGNAAEARKRLHEAEGKARAAGALNVELRALYFQAMSFDDQAEIQSAIDLYRRGIERAEESGLSWSAFGLAVRSQHLFLRYVSGDWPCDDPAQQLEAGVSSVVAARMSVIWAHIVVAKGRFDIAERLLSSEIGAQRRDDLRIPLAYGAASIELASWQGDHAGAARKAREVIGWLEEFEPWQLGALRLAALGCTAASAWAAAARVRGDAAEQAAAIAEGTALIEHARGCVEHGQPRSGSLGPEGRAWFARAEAAASGLAGGGDPARWARAVDAFGYGAVYEQAVCRWLYAKALLGTGEQGATASAAEQLALAAEVAERLGAVPLRDAVGGLARRARVDLPGEPVRRDVVDLLTDRERSVLELVAQGLTNRQVGAALYISEKTVSVHLSRVMAKLGANRRAEAVAIAYDRGLLNAPAATS
ncbi:regulatory protein, luxR family [Amycolatopsis marina]|uniref:Regulatory protein, luxR family n=1 Tax=Amycolatopsis marina TaxID=490629 RepID=A0A1I1B8G3_9PSEU|nr:LuxR family transcriptional regulator [Amycolatopsis marina]SFB46367.1 regulatory protein, luxR family [Amycolatopsis marina]